ncbi:MAG: hypothetical protein LUD68_05470 [Rikenellaceae bacterium]|nr:hypothetical protein [Rikenellaceae bacterium]
MYTHHSESEQSPEAEKPQESKLSIHAAKTVTVLLHPLLIPVWGTLLILYGPTYLSILPNSLKGYILGAVLLSTCFFPALLLGILHSLKIIPNTRFSRRERWIPFIVILTGYLICIYLLHRYISIGVLPQALIGTMILAVICFLLRLFYLLSIPMAAIGGLAALLLDIALKGYGQMLPLTMVVLLFSGLLGSCLLYLGKQQVWQIFAGFITGFGTILLSLNLF